MSTARRLVFGLVGLAGVFQLAGCPMTSPYEYIAGGTGDQTRIAAEASVNVFSPLSDLPITGGTPVEVNWTVVATTNFAVVDIIFDVDQDPDNDNEIYAQRDVELSEATAVLDTTNLESDTYFIGVVLRERNEIATFGHAPGRIIVNQRTQLFFSSPRDNFVFDRTQRVTPEFEVSWTLFDPDSTVNAQFFLDPDDTPNGNEFLLREVGPYESGIEHTGTFSFSFPTATFEPGTYRILAVVSSDVDTAEFYAPAAIRLRSRLAGVIDIRELHLPNSPVSGAVFEGFNPRDNAGSFLSSVRDIDRDGFNDFIVVSQFGKPQYDVGVQRTGVGEAYLIYGRANRFSGTINLNSTGTLFRGDVFTGVPQLSDPIRPSRGITSFAALSDWDGDGLREIAFGLPFTDSLPVGSLGSGTDAEIISALDVNGYFRSGAVVVVSSSAMRPELGFPGRNVYNLAEFGTLGHHPIECTNCSAPDRCTCLTGFVGPKAPSTACSASYFHRNWVDVVGAPNDGSVRLGCRFSSNEPFDFFGESVAAGDFDSIIIASPNRNPDVGTFTNYFGGNSIPGAGVVSIYFVNVVNGFFPWTTTQAAASNDLWPGFPTEGNVDLLPHGGPYHYILDDFRFFETAVGIQPASPGYWVDPDQSDPCEIRVARNAPGPERTVRISGGFEGARIGNVATVQDFNADGLQDILVGSPFSNEGSGGCFIVLGRLRELVMSGELELEELGLALNAPNEADARIFDGIRVVGSPDARLGQAQASADDFNSDGISDIVIGSPLINNRQGGVTVFFGSRDIINLTEVEIPFDEIHRRGLGVNFVGEDEGDLAGAAVASAGDVDGDGSSDILIAAPNRSVRLDVDFDGAIEIDRTECGVVYLIYGSSKLRGSLELADVGTEKLPGAVFVGRNSGDHLGAGLGEQGDRSKGIAGIGDVDGDGRGDVVLSSVFASPRDRVRAGEAYLVYGQGD
jgi:hypothetical protein